jgi:hypothetical protein
MAACTRCGSGQAGFVRPADFDEFGLCYSCFEELFCKPPQIPDFGLLIPEEVMSAAVTSVSIHAPNGAITS